MKSYSMPTSTLFAVVALKRMNGVSQLETRPFALLHPIFLLPGTNFQHQVVTWCISRIGPYFGGVLLGGLGVEKLLAALEIGTTAVVVGLQKTCKSTKIKFETQSCMEVATRAASTMKCLPPTLSKQMRSRADPAKLRAKVVTWCITQIARYFGGVLGGLGVGKMLATIGIGATAGAV